MSSTEEDNHSNKKTKLYLESRLLVGEFNTLFLATMEVIKIPEYKKNVLLAFIRYVNRVKHRKYKKIISASKILRKKISDLIF